MRTKTPQQIRNEVEKGCGELWGVDNRCGEHLGDGSIDYCPSCLAKLSILTEYDKSIKEMIEDRIALQKIFKMSCNWEDTILKKEANDLIIKSFEELLSKIGDVQQTSEEKQDDN